MHNVVISSLSDHVVTLHDTMFVATCMHMLCNAWRVALSQCNDNKLHSHHKTLRTRTVEVAVKVVTIL